MEAGPGEPRITASNPTPDRPTSAGVGDQSPAAALRVPPTEAVPPIDGVPAVKLPASTS